MLFLTKVFLFLLIIFNPSSSSRHVQTLERLPDPRIVPNYQHQRHHLSRYFLRRSLFSRARKSDVAAHVDDFALCTTRPHYNLRVYANDVTVERQDEIASLCAGEMFAVGSCVIHQSEERPETECEIVRHAEQSAGRFTRSPARSLARSLRYIAVSVRM